MACGKREAFAQGGRATNNPCLRWGHDGLFGACHRARSRGPLARNAQRTNDGATTVSSPNALLKNAALTAIFLIGSLVSATAQTALPDAIAAPGETAMLTLHAEGAQVYECKTGTDGALAWAFREPIATLFSGRQDGRPALRRTDLGTQRRQRRRRPGRRHGAGLRRDGHSLAEARRDFPARQRCSQSGNDGAADQHDGWKARQAPATRQAPMKASPTRPITCSCARADTTLPSGGFGQPRQGDGIIG